MKTFTIQQTGFIVTLLAAGGLALWLLLHFSARPVQSCAKETFDNINVIKLI